MAAESSEQSHTNLFGPTIHINSCSNSKIYVNTIINATHGSCQSLADASPKIFDGAGTLKLRPGDKNSGFKTESFTFNAHAGGKVNIYCDSMEETNRTPLPMISVEIHKLSSEGTSDITPMPTYIITVHTNNVSGEEPLTAVSETEGQPMIQADNVILNYSGKINLGAGAGGNNSGPAAGSYNSFFIIEGQGARIIPIESQGARIIPIEGQGARIIPIEGGGARIIPIEGQGVRIIPID